MSESVRDRVAGALRMSGESQELLLLMQSVLADLTALRAAHVALTAKMDADFANVTNASVDYTATVNPPALQTIA